MITAQPTATSVAAGQTATFKVVATGQTSIQWQYQKPGTTTWTNVANNGTSLTYTLTAATRHNGYTYRCKLTNAVGTVYSAAVKLTVN